MLPEYFRMLSNPSRIDAKRGDHFLEPDLNDAALRRTLRERRTEQWLLVFEISCRVIGGPYDPTSQNDAGRTPAS